MPLLLLIHIHKFEWREALFMRSAAKQRAGASRRAAKARLTPAASSARSRKAALEASEVSSAIAQRAGVMLKRSERAERARALQREEAAIEDTGALDSNSHSAAALPATASSAARYATAELRHYAITTGQSRPPAAFSEPPYLRRAGCTGHATFSPIV